MIHIDVRIRMPDDKSLTCGEMVATDPDFKGAMSGAFRYSNDYLSQPGAIIDKVVWSVSRWRSVFKKHVVPQPDIDRLADVIARRLKKLSR